MIKENFKVVPLAEVIAEFNQTMNMDARALGEIIKQIEHMKCDWIRIDDWEDIPDQILYQKLEDVKIPKGLLIIVTEFSYRSNLGAFKLSSNHIDKFVSEHHSRFGECFFNGDVLILSKSQNAIWLFQHEGVFTVLERN